MIGILIIKLIKGVHFSYVWTCSGNDRGVSHLGHLNPFQVGPLMRGVCPIVIVMVWATYNVRHPYVVLVCIMKSFLESTLKLYVYLLSHVWFRTMLEGTH